MQNLIETEGYSIRINYYDGDVLDQAVPNEAIGRSRARLASEELRAIVDLAHGATVLASYRDGQECNLDDLR
jgi:hypothetical protein